MKGNGDSRSHGVQDPSSAPGLLYDPPYDGLIEDWFAWHAVKYLHPSVRFGKEVWVDTIYGSFRLGFVVERDGYRVAFECTGRSPRDELWDECRDAIIVWSGGIDVIYRFEGISIEAHIEDAVGLCASREPGFFSERGIANLNRLMSATAREWTGLPEEAFTVIRYPLKARDPSLAQHTMIIRRRARLPSTWGRYLGEFFEFAVQNGGGDLDHLIKLWRVRDRYGIRGRMEQDPDART